MSVTSVLTPRLVNEWRGAYLRAALNTQALDPSAEEIPSIEITELGLVGFNAATDRTGIGLGVNLPQFSFRNTYQMQDNLSYTSGSHAFKFGFDIRRNQLAQLFKPTTRGRLQYSSLNRFVNDVAQSSTINKDLQGVAEVLHLDWHDFFFYGQDEWKVRPTFANLNSPPINPDAFARTVVSEDFHAPTYDSFSFEAQREFSRDVVLRVGYVGSKGNGLFQTLDGNPRLPFSTVRINPAQNVIRLRANSGSSIYHSMQVSLDKRLSRGFSAGLYYTWSSFIDDASEIFNPSSGEVAVSQDSFNRSADRARSTYDRPHRFSGNVVYELPFFQDQRGFMGHVLGGWQINSFFTFQSGAPFTVLNGSDPTGALSGIAGLVGDAIRPNVITTLDISGMSIEELYALRNTLFLPLRGAAVGERVGSAGRNILRADGINNIDFGVLKNTRIGENQRLQIRADFFNATNTRNFGIPDGRAFSTSGAPNAAFLNQWSTNGGNRRIIVGLRYVF